MFEYYVSIGELSEGATILAGVNVASSAYSFNDYDVANLYIKCAGMYSYYFVFVKYSLNFHTISTAEAYLGEDESIEAETMLNKAAPFINNLESQCSSGAEQDKDNDEKSEVISELHLRYRVTSARVLDANRKFTEAAFRYYELSNIKSSKIVEGSSVLNLRK